MFCAGIVNLYKHKQNDIPTAKSNKEHEQNGAHDNRICREKISTGKPRLGDPAPVRRAEWESCLW